MTVTCSIRETIAGNIRANRARMQMSQKDVADAIGVDESTLSNYETGKTGISLERALKLCEVFGIALGELGKKAS